MSLLTALGSADQQEAWLSAIARGDAIVIPALLEPSGVWDDGGIDLAATETASGFQLDGNKVLVPFAADAGQLLVAGRHGEGISLFLVAPDAPGITITAQQTLASLPVSVVELSGVQVGPDSLIGQAGGAWPAIAEALARGAVLRCAEIVGAGERMLDMMVDYAMNRVQFGTPIGRHQAVQYLCTDVAIESHLSGILSRRAAYLLDSGPWDQAAVAVHAAKLYASRAAHHMTQQAHEIFAGLAFMMEHDLHLFTRHAKHWEHDLGDVRHHGEQLVRAMV